MSLYEMARAADALKRAQDEITRLEKEVYQSDMAVYYLKEELRVATEKAPSQVGIVLLCALLSVIFLYLII